MKLFITEKPNVAKSIAKALWPHGYEAIPKQGFITDKIGTVITWSYGHILRLAQPEEYNPELKGWKNYPIFPKEWKLLPYANTQAQLHIIRQLLPRTIWQGMLCLKQCTKKAQINVLCKLFYVVFN